MKKLAIALSLALVAALILVYSKVRRFSAAEHETFQTSLWRLKQLDTTFRQDLLKARFALRDHYDDFQSYDAESSELVNRVRTLPDPIDQDERSAFEVARLRFAGLLGEQKLLLERFKS